MAEQHNWASVLRGVLQQMAKTDVTELEVRQGDLRLKLRRASHPTARAAHLPARTSAPEPSSPSTDDLHRVTAPLTGVFFSASSPTSQPYVSVGDWVEQDTVVGLIETMKVFNEVVADCGGRVAAILVQQGQLVHSGEPLLMVDLSASPDHNEVAP